MLIFHNIHLSLTIYTDLLLQRAPNRSYRQAWNEDTMNQLEAEMSDMKVSGMNRLSGQTSARFTSNRFSQKDNRVYL